MRLSLCKLRQFYFFLFALLPQVAFMSGSLEESKLEDNITTQNNIYVVTITSQVNGKVKEIEKIDTEVSGITIYRAKIESIYYKSKFASGYLTDQWHILFSKPVDDIIKIIKLKKNNYPEINDEILIADYENINYSYIYYVEGRHKIFIYHSCIDSTKTIKIGEKYYFINTGVPSKTNPVFYGNIGLGLFPFTNTIEERIKKVIIQ
jgi:hypothetical protein